MSYAPIGETSENSANISVSQNDDEVDLDDAFSLRSGMSRKSQLPIELSEPLTNGGSNGGKDQDDPFYVFRSDLYRKLQSVDDSLAEFLRIVHQTVSRCPMLNPALVADAE
jgi:hypothetical protein